MLPLLLLVATACATPIGVRRVDARTVHSTLTRNALSQGRPSTPSLHVLQRLALLRSYETDPEAALARLHAGLAATGDEDRLFALAELSFLRAERGGGRAHYLAVVVYAHAFLFPGADGRPPEPTDPRLRLALDLYNRGLTGGLMREDEVRLEAGRYPLPFGALEIEVAPGTLQWAGYRLEQFVPAAELDVRGLRNRYRRPGIGAPLAASLAHGDAGDAPPGHERIPRNLKAPVTAFLRLSTPRHDLGAGRLHGSLELYSPDAVPRVRIGEQEVPLEFETSAALAYGLEESAIWSFELAGFRSGDLLPFEVRRPDDRLLMLHPYRPGHIPIVLVHGTASSPGRWAELVNELQNDRRIWERYQIWLFVYNTGNPILYSGGLLREALRRTVAELDPEGRDASLSRMVVVGHSQGGLLAKLAVVRSGDRFWQNLSDVPLRELDLDPRTRSILRRTLFFEALPFVERVVFVATPHHGSYLAGMRIGRFVSALVKLPASLMQLGVDVATRNPEAEVVRSLRRLPTSVEDMTPGNPFLQTLAETSVAPGVLAHSIIAVQGSGPPEQGSDGVVDYESAHLDGVASERVVRSGHSAQSHPEAIEEIRRILLEHAGAG